MLAREKQNGYVMTPAFDNFGMYVILSLLHYFMQAFYVIIAFFVICWTLYLFSANRFTPINNYVYF